MTPDPIAYRARGNAAEAAYEGATTMTIPERRFTAAELEEEAAIREQYVLVAPSPQHVEFHRRFAAMMRQAARDAAIVERLPRTADGVPVVPGMEVYIITKGFTINGIVQMMSGECCGQTSGPGVHWWRSANECYATHGAAAAEAAAKEAK